MTTQMEYATSQCYGVRGMYLPEYYSSTIGKIFGIQEDRVFLGDDVITVVYSDDLIISTWGDELREIHQVVTEFESREIIEHQIWYDEEGDVHEKRIQAIKEYTGGDAVLNHYIALLLRFQSQGIKKFYSDCELSPGTIKIYERLRKLGRNVHGPCDSIDSSGTVKSSIPIYYIELQKSHEN